MLAPAAWWWRWRYARSQRHPFPEDWRELLRKHVPFYGRLSGALQAKFESDLKFLLERVPFTGVQGMEVDDRVRVVIAATAARLILHLDITFYRKLAEIVVYPFDYKHPSEEQDSRDETAVFGEAHAGGTVVLSWPAVVRGLNDPRDGHDTATHEFAHVLDASDGRFDGTPPLRSSEDYRPWAHIMQKRFDNLRDHQRAESKVLRDYGATNEAEFFAVATEAFFEKPNQMKRRTPDLYDQLQAFYGFDPAASVDG